MAWNGTRTSFQKVNITPWAGVAIWTLLWNSRDMGIHIFDRPFGTLDLKPPTWAKATCRETTNYGLDQDDCRPWIQTNTSTTKDFPGPGMMEATDLLKTMAA